MLRPEWKNTAAGGRRLAEDDVKQFAITDGFIRLRGDGQYELIQVTTESKNNVTIVTQLSDFELAYGESGTWTFVMSVIALSAAALVNVTFMFLKPVTWMMAKATAAASKTEKNITSFWVYVGLHLAVVTVLNIMIFANIENTGDWDNLLSIYSVLTFVFTLIFIMLALIKATPNKCCTKCCGEAVSYEKVIDFSS